MKSDIEIAKSIEMKPIQEITNKLNIKDEDLQLYGRYKAKLPLHLINDEKAKNSKLILVSAVSPTPAGEGKTTTSIGLTQGLNKIGKQTMVVLREPSLGPVFGIKGGAAGGGWSQVVPMEDINLHFTGDFSAIEKAHNLLAALIDNNIHSKKRNLGIDPRTVIWKRVMDMNDRALRDVIIGLGGRTMGVPRESGFDITAASEIMAILCLASNRLDLKRRLGNIFIGYTYQKQPIYAKDLNAQGAMTALLKDAIMPNIVQTLEGAPAIIHGGPFANIAQGTNSVIATRMGMSLADYVVTEAGFGLDLGAEKFFNIKCVSAGLLPQLVVIVATIRAIKYHSGQGLKELTSENVDAVTKGLENLEKHIENAYKFGVQPIVAINKFNSDTEAEIKVVINRCNELGVAAVESEVWAKGGDGAIGLAHAVIQAIESGKSNFKPLYDWNMPVIEKIETISKEIYGADAVKFTSKAELNLKTIKNLGLESLPICMAKTQKSLSDNPKLLGRPRDFSITVREIEIASGAGFLVPITGNMMRMPGLPSTPAAEKIDIDEEGNISGLF